MGTYRQYWLNLWLDGKCILTHPDKRLFPFVRLCGSSSVTTTSFIAPWSGGRSMGGYIAYNWSALSRCIAHVLLWAGSYFIAYVDCGSIHSILRSCTDHRRFPFSGICAVYVRCMWNTAHTPHQNSTKTALKSHQNSTKTAPKSHQSSTKTAPK